MRHPHLDVRRAVRTALSGLPDGSAVLVACSGGADSLSLAAATAWVAARGGSRAGAVCVDHGLQPGSADQARSTAAALCGLGLDPVVTVHADASRGPDGPEGNARAVRYAALTAAAERTGAAAVLLGHTLDDQAETVLLGLARGSGPRSLSGMAARSGVFLRPLLGLRRSVVRAALPAGLEPWDDPHNEEFAYARARVRHRVLPVLEAELGPGVAEALARTAELARADADALDAQATAFFASDARDRSGVDHGESGVPDRRKPGPLHDRQSGGVPLAVTDLAALPRAVRWRVLRRAAIAAGSPPTDLTAAHVAAIDTLVTAWRGQDGIDLPGAIRATRAEGALHLTPRTGTAAGGQGEPPPPHP
ncbi:tRNA lysidine(34) synthetase TilS [Jiangella ureilytica]|uniref:tRNA(Ile)-lysidine synthase n=1 Tax=Jiangella ureilytica TaxID=2530374 RepID=A0A4R4RPV1_9ACTN|nr:tRNA lysidine(34) synthetase TilS [Jiangella ureilytica]TDC51887.1 tRNA lysidine(34) synthetase TilS [Jiangella ureilytica]